MAISIAKRSREPLIFYSLLLLVAAVFVSRAWLSIALVIFLLLTLVHGSWTMQWENFRRRPVLWGMTVLFLVPFVSGLWSHSAQQWGDIVRIKLPLLALPLAFAGNWKLPARQWLVLAWLFVAATAFGACWSLFQYVLNPQVIAASYLKAKSLPTPLEDDHVRFSWTVSTAIVCCFILLQETVKRWQQALLVAIAVFMAVYLHILAARTGLFSFYIFILLYLFYRLFLHGRFASSAAFVGVFLVFPLLAWWLFPTFQNRVHYMVYDLSFVKAHTYLPGSNDGARSLSIEAGWSILKSHPWGVGAGDVKTHETLWYQAHVPGMLATDQFYPSSEWLMYGDFAGWPGVLLLTGALALPLFVRPVRYAFFWIVLNATAGLSFLFDMGLEVQYGVFLYGFIVLWWYKWFNQANQKI